MKFAKSQLKQIIKEELQRVLNEIDEDDTYEEKYYGSRTWEQDQDQMARDRGDWSDPQENFPPGKPMEAYGQAQAEEGVQTVYDEAWSAYTTGMQELYNHARDIGNIIKPLYNKAAKSGNVEAAEGIRTLMAFTAVSGYRPPDGGPTLQGAISAFGDRVDAGLKKVGFRGPTNIDYLIGTTQPRHPAPDIMDVMNDRTWSGGKYSE